MKYEDIEENSEPTLFPSAEKITYWKKELAKLPHKISIGISWRSGIALANRSRNYAPLLNWQPLLSHKNVNFINLQYGDCTKELAELKGKTGIKIHNFEELNLKDDFDGTTALMTCLDLAMGPASSPTMQSQMAGVPIWFLLAGTPWWGFGEKIPKWRQNARIISKNENDPWLDHMVKCRSYLEEWVKSRTGSSINGKTN